MFNCVKTVFPDELKQLSEELVEVSTSKRALQVKVDQLESAQANIKVSYISINSFLKNIFKVVYIQSDLLLKVI